MVTKVTTPEDLFLYGLLVLLGFLDFFFPNFVSLAHDWTPFQVCLPQQLLKRACTFGRRIACKNHIVMLWCAEITHRRSTVDDAMHDSRRGRASSEDPDLRPSAIRVLA